MTPTSAEAKLRLLAQQDATISAIFGETNGIFRWFGTQLVPGYLAVGKTCARVLRVSTARLYAHETATRRSESRMQLIRFQIDVLDYDLGRALSAASSVSDWLALIDLSSDSQFASPPTSPTRHPNQVLNQRAGLEPNTQPPVHVAMLDVRIFNLEE